MTTCVITMLMTMKPLNEQCHCCHAIGFDFVMTYHVEMDRNLKFL